MPYDPSFPASNVLLVSAEFRSQFQGLFDLIQSIPVGPQGPPFATALVDGVNTLNPGEAATVQSSFDGTNVHLIFGIPRGADGNNGADGTNGADGAQGPPFTNFIVDRVNTLDPGQDATVEANFDGAAVRLVVGVPQGFNGTNGNDGPQGLPGEVTSMDLNSAIGGTSSNSNTVSTLDSPFTNDPPTLADLETLRGKINELIMALRR